MKRDEVKKGMLVVTTPMTGAAVYKVGHVNGFVAELSDTSNPNGRPHYMDVCYLKVPTRAQLAATGLDKAA